MKSEYGIQADKFLRKTKSELEVKFLRCDKHFNDDEYECDIYEITITRGGRKFVCELEQSINCSGKWWKYGNYKQGITNTKLPTYEQKDWSINPNYEALSAYDVLADLEKCEPGTFEEFCDNYGYDTDSRKAEVMYKAIQKEYNGLALLYNNVELEKMAEIT